MRAILINPYNQTVSEIDTSGELKGPTGFYAILSAADPMFTNMVERVGVDKGIDLWIDEESALSDGRPVFQFKNGPAYSGAAFLFGIDEEGEGLPLPEWMTVALVASRIEWTDLMTTGDFGPTTEKDVDHPVFGKTHAVIGGDPIYRAAAGYFVYVCYRDKSTLASAQQFRTRNDALVFAKTVGLHGDCKTEVREAGH